MYVTFKLEVLYRHHPLFNVAFIYGIITALRSSQVIPCQAENVTSLFREYIRNITTVT